MKKAFLVFSLCLVLALAGLTAAVVSLHDSRDNVEVTLTNRAGDPIHAQGLTARQTVRHAEHLFWDLAIPAQDPVLAETRFSFYPTGLAWEAYQETPLSLYTSDSSFLYLEGTHTTPTFESLEGDPALSQLLPLLEEMADRTEPGKSVSQTIHPADYLDTCPLSVYAVLPNTALRYDETTTDHYDQNLLLPRFFQKAFPLTFVPEEEWTITMEKRETGFIRELSYSSNGITNQIDLLTDYNDQALYLGLGQNTWPQPDFSRFPQGNGVYRMEIVQEKDMDYIEVQTLTNIFPIPDEAMVLDLTLDGDDTLLVTWYDAGEYFCTILDTKTLKPRETFPVFREERKEAEVYTSDSLGRELSYQTWAYENLQAIPGEDFLLFLGDQQFWLFLPSENGWQEQFSAPLHEDLWYTSDLQMDAAWNGEKLAMGSADGWVSGLDLWVYDGTGDLLFHGHYDTSLTDGPNTEGYNHRSNVFPMEGKELELHWK